MTKKTFETGILYLLLLGVCVVLLIPFVWLLSTALKSESADLFAFPPLRLSETGCKDDLLKPLASYLIRFFPASYISNQHIP